MAIAAAVYVGRKNILLSLSLLVFAVEFIVLSWFATHPVADIEHVQAVLQNNPVSIVQSYVQELITNTILYGIVPTVAGIGLFVASILLHRKTVLGWVRSLLLLVAGSLGIFQGASNLPYVQELASSPGEMQAIYSVQECLNILWIIAGALLVATSVIYSTKLAVQAARSTPPKVPAQGTDNLVCGEMKLQKVLRNEDLL
jgi:hypothetical protein